jgi:hypothetical protein
MILGMGVYMRSVALIGVAVLLSACGLGARQEREQQMTAAKAAMADGFEQCKAQFPDGSKQYIEKNKCNANAALVIKPYVTYPDLFDQDWAARAVLAEKLQAGKITVAEANQEASTVHSQVASEEQRRNLANRSVGAQESAAAAAWVSGTGQRLAANRQI